MFSKFNFTIFGLLVLAALLIAGCGSDDEATNPGIVNEIVDSISNTVAASLNEASLARTTPIEPTTEEAVKLITEIADLELVDSKLYGVFNGGVAIYDFANKSYSIIPSGEKLRAVAHHEGQVYVGGTNLYTVNDSTLERLDNEFEGVITTLYSYGYRLMVGTECGLYSAGMFGNELLFDEIPVSAIAADESGLWIGTEGEGLYRWDGGDFTKRFLRRDTALFDTVNTLDFNHSHLYVGTVNGFHIYDGGSWKTLTNLDGLPADNVVSVDASEWVVYVGTDEGVVSYFNGDVIQVNKLEETRADALCVDGRRIIAGTEYEGIVMKSGRVFKTLVPVDDGMNFDVLSLVP